MKFSLASANVDLIFCGVEPFDELVNIGTGRGQHLKQLCTKQSQRDKVMDRNGGVKDSIFVP